MFLWRTAESVKWLARRSVEDGKGRKSGACSWSFVLLGLFYVRARYDGAGSHCRALSGQSVLALALSVFLFSVPLAFALSLLVPFGFSWLLTRLPHNVTGHNLSFFSLLMSILTARLILTRRDAHFLRYTDRRDQQSANNKKKERKLR